MKNTPTLALILITIFTTPSLFAQDATTTSDGQVQMVVPQKAKKTVYNFDEVDILGKLKKPEGQTVISAPEFQFKKLLNLDESFIPNILNSVDEY